MTNDYKKKELIHTNAFSINCQLLTILNEGAESTDDDGEQKKNNNNVRRRKINSMAQENFHFDSIEWWQEKKNKKLNVSKRYKR